jgi:hypothetical protein
MEITRNGPASPGDPRRRADEARVDNLVNVRSRAIAAREELERYRELLADKTRVQRERAVRADEREAQRAERTERPDARGDRIDLSERARRLARVDEQEERGVANLAERVRRLAALERDGELASPERLDRAARRLLGGAD